MGKAAPVSPFAPKSLPDVPAIAGVRFATAEAGIRYKGRTDLLLAVLDPGTTAAGVLTRSQDAARRRSTGAPSAADGKARARSSSIPATPTPSPARRDARRCEITAEAAARRVGCPQRGLHRLDRRHRRAAGGRQVRAPARPARWRGRAADAWHAAARAIMTTDTFPKLATRQADDRRRGGTHQRLLPRAPA